MKRLENRTAIITGGGSGIGRAIATTFARHGAQVYIPDYLKESAEETTKQIQNGGGVAYAGQCDVSDETSVQTMVADAMEKMGSIDILVNNAGIELHKAIEEMSAEEWDRVMAVNVRGMFLCCKHTIPHMKKAGKGNIVNMGSTGGYIAAPFQTVYCASKGAVHQFTKALALECSPAGIRVNAIAPGGVDTPMLDYLEESNKKKGVDDLKVRVSEVQLGGLIQPQDIADLALFLASDESRTIHGTAVLIDGGYTAM
ncbi:SDR family NAD(P)-dependent oxidoreductase [uncultured Desulfosarcina sp.]|uniref:SDR family NAD(P)-dependent oxidoreductase n=1 Tax=uncultured Desulfosarcina sp. TaxID=218289 RepID=UPI0029C70AF0|nr:SDR family NAD(P)-dependent oxidoreductase [uncultured Desulfosarcina sp.]